MNCVICGQECHEAFLRLGGFCSAEHGQEILSRHHQRLSELRREPVALMPETFDRDAFERFALKLAVHLLAGIGEETREEFRRRLPGLLEPLEMALELKERILRQLPVTHVLLTEATGLARLFHSGTYTLLQPIPASLMRQAVEQAHHLPLLASDGS
jgi:hypothetical protein